MFPMLSFEQANPVTGVQKMQNQQLMNSYMQLMNQQQAMKNQVTPQTLQEELLKLRLGNDASQAQLPYAGPQAAANVGLANSQAGLYGSEAAKNRFMVNNPAYMASTPLAQIVALQGLMKTNPGLFSNGGGSTGNNPAQPQAPTGASGDGGMGNLSPLQQMLQQPPANPNGGMPSSPLPGLGSPMGMPNAQGGAPSGVPGATPMNPAQPGMQGQGTANDLKSTLLNSIMAPMQLQAAKTQLYNQKINGASYMNSPPDTKRLSVAQATAFGYSPDEAVRNFMGGKSVADLGKAKGFGEDPAGWPTPDYNPTIATLSRNQQRNTAISELGAVEPFINGSLGPYSQTIHGFSPQQVMDSFASLHGNTPEGAAKKEKLSNFLAATIITPEYNAIRARAMGVQNIGVEAMRGIGDASMNNFKKFQSLVPSDVYMTAQTKANEMIRKMNSAANKASLVTYQAPDTQGAPTGGFSDQVNGLKTGGQTPPGALVRIQAPDGKIFSASPEQANRFLADHKDHKRLN